MARAVEVLDYLAELARGEPSPRCVAWLADGIRDSLAGGGDLSHTLGMANVHPRGWKYALRYRQMVKALLAAASTIPAQTTWGRAAQLSSEIVRFRRTRWKRWAKAGQAPLEAAGLDLRLFDAFRASPNGLPPSSVPRLYALLVDEEVTLHADPAAEVEDMV